jgi:hypothetical protein
MERPGSLPVRLSGSPELLTQAGVVYYDILIMASMAANVCNLTTDEN